MDVYWIWLSTVPYVGPVQQKRLLHCFQTPRAVYEADEVELRAVQGLHHKAIESILHHRSLDKAKRILDQADRQSIHLLTMNSPLYPLHAKSRSVSPIVLYYRGQLQPIDDAVVVIGTRRCTDYGKKVACELAAQLASSEVPVISGLAKGIDGYAHTACLRAGGYTVALVANGADVCYPKEHRSLYEEIVTSGAVIS
jgi:DNA processing protein